MGREGPGRGSVPSAASWLGAAGEAPLTLLTLVSGVRAARCARPRARPPSLSHRPLAPGWDPFLLVKLFRSKTWAETSPQWSRDPPCPRCSRALSPPALCTGQPLWLVCPHPGLVLCPPVAPAWLPNTPDFRPVSCCGVFLPRGAPPGDPDTVRRTRSELLFAQNWAPVWQVQGCDSELNKRFAHRRSERPRAGRDVGEDLPDLRGLVPSLCCVRRQSARTSEVYGAPAAGGVFLQGARLLC